MSKFKERFFKTRDYILDRLGEKSTWQGIGFLATLFISKELALLDWGLAAALGSAVSGVIKMLFPDDTGDVNNTTVVVVATPEKEEDKNV